MGLEGVEPVRREGDDGAARPRHADHLGGRGPVVVDVLDDLVGEDEVEVVVGVGQGLAHAEHDVGQLRAGLGDPLRLDLDAVDVVAEYWRKRRTYVPMPQPTSRMRGALEVHEAAHHLEPAVLAVAPRVARPPALDRRRGTSRSVVLGIACLR